MPVRAGDQGLAGPLVVEQKEWFAAVVVLPEGEGQFFLAASVFAGLVAQEEAPPFLRKYPQDQIQSYTQLLPKLLRRPQLLQGEQLEFVLLIVSR